MAEAMNIEDYLAKGGVLTAPDNVPPRYRGELLRLMSSFVDSELAASAGFAASINFAPGIEARIAASRITLEKAEHAGRVLAIMGDFGTDVAAYQQHKDWAARGERNAPAEGDRWSGDMRLPVFRYPIGNWADGVMLNVLQGLAAQVQLAELTHMSYAPLAEAFRVIAPREAQHTELGFKGLADLQETERGRETALAALAYWQPRVAAGFGRSLSDRQETLERFGLRRATNEVLLAQWTSLSARRLHPFGL